MSHRGKKAKGDAELARMMRLRGREDARQGRPAMWANYPYQRAYREARKQVDE